VGVICLRNGTEPSKCRATKFSVPFRLWAAHLRCQFWADCITNISERRFPTGTGVLHQIHFNCSMTVPSEIVGRATPVLLAFLAIHSRATRLLSSAPALSW